MQYLLKNYLEIIFFQILSNKYCTCWKVRLENIEKEHIFLDRTKDLGINIVHIESRKSMRRGSEYDILVDVECDSRKMEQLMKMLSREVAAVNLAHYEQIGNIPRAPSLSAATSFGESLICNIDRKSIKFFIFHYNEIYN